jgi:proline iminopeptidase
MERKELYPEIEPNDQGMLEVGDGNLVYWETCGNPDGKPAVALHGGPGSGWNPGIRRFFDPDAYRLVVFDQRGSGRSTPHASEPTTDLRFNTTKHLLADIELLRHHLGIDRWLVFGGSWGATLSLAYAERNPKLVTEIVLVGVTSTRRSEIDWLYRGVAPLFPEEWERFRAGVPAAERDGNLTEAYGRLLEDPDPAVRAKAAQDWCNWELALISPDPDYRPSPRWSSPRWRLAFARIVTHYFRHAAWLEEGVLLKEAGSLAGIPGVLVHGRLDLGAPLVTAWELARAWPDAELVVIDGAGHDAGHPGTTESVLAALDRFAARG